MPQYLPKNELVQGAELKVQRLAIPLTIVGNATAGNVSLRNGEPGFVFMKSAGVDQITAALASGETATYTTAPADATGVFQVLLAINESVSSVLGASLVSRTLLASQNAILGSATGITTGSAGGQKIMIVCDCSSDLSTATTAELLLEVAYTVAK